MLPNTFLRAFASLALAAGLMLPPTARANDIPSKPDRYFNDYANVVDAGTADEINQTLDNFERQTSNQIVVAVYPNLQTDDALDDFCYRTAQAWAVGQKGKNNGAVLFVFVKDHKMNIQTGYGLEGALPDVTCVRILDDIMAPRFKQGDYAGGLRAGVNAMIAATKGEFVGNGRTVNDSRYVSRPVSYSSSSGGSGGFGAIFPILFLLLWVVLLFRRTRGVSYGSSGPGFWGGMLMGSLMNSGGGGGWNSGGGGGWSGGGGGGFSGGGGGGGFSGGGGSFGGGGASGSW